MPLAPPFSSKLASIRVLTRFLLRLVILGIFATFGTQGFEQTLGGLAATAMACCIFIAAVRREALFGRALTHFDEAAAYAAIACLVLSAS